MYITKNNDKNAGIFSHLFCTKPIYNCIYLQKLVYKVTLGSGFYKIRELYCTEVGFERCLFVQNNSELINSGIKRNIRVVILLFIQPVGNFPETFQPGF